MSLCHSIRRVQRLLTAAAICAAALGVARPAAAQAAGDPPGARQTADARAPGASESLVLFNVPFYGRGANSIEPGDSLVGPLTTERLRDHLESSGRFHLVDSARVAAEVARAEARGLNCNTLECRREIAQRLGAKWMVTAKFSKLSNLIWYFSGQLTDVSSGRRLLDDEFELKGIVDDMSRGGAKSMARRIVKAADRGEVAASAP